MKIAGVVLSLAVLATSFVGGGWLSDRRNAELIAKTNATVDSLQEERAQDSIAIAQIRDSLARLDTIGKRQAADLAAAKRGWQDAAVLADSAMDRLELVGIESATRDDLLATLELQADARARAEDRAAAAEANLVTVTNERDLARQEITRLTSMLATADKETHEWKRTTERLASPKWTFRDGVAVGGLATAIAMVVTVLAAK